MVTRSQLFTRRIKKIATIHFRKIAALLAGVILAAGYVLILNPKVSEIRTVGIFDLQRTKNQLEAKRNIQAATVSLVQKYQGLNLTDVEKLNNILSIGPDLPSLFVQVEALANAAGLQLRNISFSLPAPKTAQANAATTTEGGLSASKTATPSESGQKATTGSAKAGSASIQQLNVLFSVSGGHGYEDLKKFLAIVESSNRLFDIQSLNYTPAPIEKQEQYEINAVTYFLGS